MERAARRTDQEDDSYMMKNPFSMTLMGFSLLFLLLSSAGYAEDGRIADLTVTFDHREILATARLDRGFHKNIEEDIHNGIPKDLFYYILLKRRQSVWFDEEILSKTIKHTIKYDILKKQYQITTRTGNIPSETQVESYEEMRRLISEIKNVKIAPTVLLRRDETYYVSVKAEMRATKLPFYLNYLLFFIPFLELDTPWANSSPFYNQNE